MEGDLTEAEWAATGLEEYRVIKQQFGYAKVRYRGLAKNTARLTMIFALSNLWMARRQLLSSQG